MVTTFKKKNPNPRNKIKACFSYTASWQNLCRVVTPRKETYPFRREKTIKGYLESFYPPPKNHNETWSLEHYRKNISFYSNNTVNKIRLVNTPAQDWSLNPVHNHSAFPSHQTIRNPPASNDILYDALEKDPNPQNQGSSTGWEDGRLTALPLAWAPFSDMELIKLKSIN